MRKLDKGKPIRAFVDFVRKNKPKSWKEAEGVSREWREHILNHEQHGLSGYTECPIKLDGSHIDHFRKCDFFNTLVFDWDNFIVDAVDDKYGARYKDNQIKSREDNERLINPTAEDACRFFKYELNGRIAVTDGLNEEDKARAEYTIKSFNLNESSLVYRRRMLINTIMEPYKDLGDDVILEALSSVGFTSVVEQLLKERKTEEDAL